MDRRHRAIEARDRMRASGKPYKEVLREMLAEEQAAQEAPAPENEQQEGEEK